MWNNNHLVKLVDWNNQAFINGEADLPASKTEIINNLRMMIGIIPIIDNPSKAWLRRTGLLVNLFWLVVFFVMDGLALTNLYEAAFLISDKTAVYYILIVFSLLPFYSFIVSLRFLMSLNPSPMKEKRAEEIFNALYQNRVLLEGKIKNLKYDGLTWLIYTFLDSSGKTITGKYGTDEKHMAGYCFVPNDTVMVLYLDEKFHVLL